MKQGVTFLHELDEGDIEWLLGNASEQLSAADEVLIEAGETVDAIHIVLQGVLWVVLPEGGTRSPCSGPVTWSETCRSSKRSRPAKR